jgi:hypothetical protein
MRIRIAELPSSRFSVIPPAALTSHTANNIGTCNTVTLSDVLSR